MYIADQAPFFNGVIEIETKLSPSALLLRLIEWWSKIRYGPRSVDLYIIYYGIGIGTENESESESESETGKGNGNETGNKAGICADIDIG
jgi:7,8-dihydro-6-hydroxymethylpterin-pyrophosphokinase